MFIRISSRQPADTFDAAIRRVFANDARALAKYKEVRAGQLERASGQAIEIPDEVLAALGDALDPDKIASFALSLGVSGDDLKEAIKSAQNAAAGAPPGTNAPSSVTTRRRAEQSFAQPALTPDQRGPDLSGFIPKPQVKGDVNSVPDADLRWLLQQGPGEVAEYAKNLEVSEAALRKRMASVKPMQAGAAKDDEAFETARVNAGRSRRVNAGVSRDRAGNVRFAITPAQARAMKAGGK